MRLIWCGVKLFVLGCLIELVRKLVIWRAERAKDYSEPQLIFLSRWFSGLCAKFGLLGREFEELGKRYK